MKLNPFDSVENYPQMRNKISFFTLTVAIFCVVLVKNNILAVSTFLDTFSIEVVLLPDLPLPIGIIVPALLIALFFHIIKFHDQLSNIFRIRRNFDIYRILIPMALLSSSNLSQSKLGIAKQRRKELMNQVFSNMLHQGRTKRLLIHI